MQLKAQYAIHYSVTSPLLIEWISGQCYSPVEGELG